MTEHHAIESTALLWFGGWLIATVSLFAVGVRLSLTRQARGWRRLRSTALAVGALASAVLANLALSLHDAHFDLTREKVFTPAAAALAVVDRLERPVRITYFYRSDDPSGKRAGDVLALMGRRNRRLIVRAVDPARDPRLAAEFGVTLDNVAVIEAGGRQLLVRGTDETEFAIGIQRVLRERSVGVCFIEGHGEYPSANYEFHSHLEAAVGHSHDDAAAVIDTTEHGYGRFRRSLESLGFDVQAIDLAQPTGIPRQCHVVIDGGPRTTYTPNESAALATYVANGGSALLMFEPGYALEPGLATLLGNFGLDLPPAKISDPQNHQGTDSTMVSVTAYAPHPITRQVSYTFFPGARPLVAHLRNGSIAFPLVEASTSSTSHPFLGATDRAVMPPAISTANVTKQPLIAAAIDGAPPDAKPFRAVVVGDADFASNSFYPYAANSDLALSMVRWLLREEAAVAVASRIPVPPVLVLTKSQMKAVFLLVEILLPLTIAMIGGVVWWRRR